MMHGPCGEANLNSPCMKKRSCSKGFPERYVDCTTTDGDGYPLYSRRKKITELVRKKNPWTIVTSFPTIEFSYQDIGLISMLNCAIKTSQSSICSNT